MGPERSSFRVVVIGRGLRLVRYVLESTFLLCLAAGPFWFGHLSDNRWRWGSLGCRGTIKRRKKRRIGRMVEVSFCRCCALLWLLSVGSADSKFLVYANECFCSCCCPHFSFFGLRAFFGVNFSERDVRPGSDFLSFLFQEGFNTACAGSAYDFISDTPRELGLLRKDLNYSLRTHRSRAQSSLVRSGKVQLHSRLRC